MSANPTPPDKLAKIERVEKPWGYELIWAKTKNYVAKVLFIKAGESLSLQYHHIKEETLFLESGECQLEVGEHPDSLSTLKVKAGESFHLPPGRIHRMKAIKDCRFFEVSTPFLADVVRLKDQYGRT